MTKYFRIILSSILITAFITPFFVFAENMEQKCFLLTEVGCGDKSSSQCRAELEQCEAYYQQESKRIEADLSKTGDEKKTLQNKIYSLNSKIKNLNYKVYQSNLVIKDLGVQIEDTKDSIVTTSSKIDDSKDKLANILRTIYEEDQKPMVEVLLSEQDLSGFFDNLIALEILSNENKELLYSIKTLKTNLVQQEETLGGERDDLEDMIKIQKVQIEENDKTKQEQQYYLNITEQQYQKQLQEKKETDEKASAIRARIFELAGVPAAPTFGEALEIAESIEKLTGVRPALLLAVLTQESNIGKNVGQCYIKNPATGAGVGIRTGNAIDRVMKPSRDVSHFLSITKELGRDPYNTPVSCPMSYGWGGAMGPAQFIPSTWIIYRDELSKITGKPGDPWDIKDAFLAAALYLKDYGAAQQTYNGEWKAAMIYFSGTSQRTKYNGYGFYGDSVMKITAGYAEDIKAIK